MVRPVASPLPLGLFALAVASVLVGLEQQGIIPATEMRPLFVMVAIFVAPAQLIATLFAFQTREPLVATGIGLIALLWPTTAAVSYLLPPTMTTSRSLGFLYICVAAVELLIAIPAASAKPLLSIVLLVAAARFVLTGIFELDMSKGMAHASGIVGFALAGLAAYAALALGLEDVRHKPVLPTGKIGEAREALNGDLGFQIGSVATEAGVRRQL